MFISISKVVLVVSHLLNTKITKTLKPLSITSMTPSCSVGWSRWNQPSRIRITDSKIKRYGTTRSGRLISTLRKSQRIRRGTDVKRGMVVRVERRIISEAERGSEEPPKTRTQNQKENFMHSPHENIKIIIIDRVRFIEILLLHPLT